MIGLHDQLEAAFSGRYQIERELGRGGMAIVYLARDVKHSRRVAVKVLRPELATSLGAERFLREINVAAALSHPNIVPLYDSGEADDLLYYVMPYVEGESLRDRLDRERQLPIDEAIGIARQVASALDYAHAKGVVHRDIKPENVLLRGDQVLVADFGLARALYTASSSRLTKSGMAVGTPAYMSPEQAAGDSHVDARSDVYALACVSFEMVAGVPPYRGATAQAVIAHHVSSAPPSLREERLTCPPVVDAAVRRALAKVPADRFRSAGEFARAMDTSAPSPLAPPANSTSLRTARAGFAVAALLGATALAAYAIRSRDRALDPSNYLLMPFTTVPGSASDMEGRAVTRRLSEALAEWQGVKQINERRMREAIDEIQFRRGTGPVRTSDALGVARKLGAGRLVWGDVRLGGDSTTVRATVYDVETGQELRSRTATYAARELPTQHYRWLASAMVREGTELPWSSAADRWSASLSAWQAYDSGRLALRDWDLVNAERQLRRAVRIDPNHAQAQLWLAQVLIWADQPASTDERRLTARRAAALETRLTASDGQLARAVHALTDARFAEACEHYRAALQTGGAQFTSWIGLGDCQARDSAVVVDRRSQSGHAFRGSYHAAAEAYRRAVEALASPHPSFPYRRLLYVLFPQSNRMRLGHLIDADTAWFAAYPALVRDTLAFVPYPAAMVTAADPRVIPASLPRALSVNRRALRQVFSSWVRAAPESPDAHERLGQVLETLGLIGDQSDQTESAISAFRRARALASDSLRRLSLAAAEVRLLVKSENFVGAKRLADSVLGAWVDAPSETADSLIGLAVLTGRLGRAIGLQQASIKSSEPPIFAPDGSPVQVPPALLNEWAAVLVRASVGVCDDRLRTFEAYVDDALESYYVDASERTRARDALLVRPLSLAVPCLGANAVTRIGRRPERLIPMQQALARGDVPALRAHFDTLRVLRQHDRPGDIAIDYIYMEAWLLAAIGDTASAIRRLDLALDAPATLGSFLLLDAPHAGGFIRAISLRVDLGARAGDVVGAKRWAQAVSTLWADADPNLQPHVSRLNALIPTRNKQQAVGRTRTRFARSFGLGAGIQRRLPVSPRPGGL